jgi:DNA repair exonuclease SbcCD ATPase subunit
MDEFYMTQQISKPFGENTYKDFSKTIGNFNPYNTFKSQDTNFTTFQKTNNINNFLKDKNIYNIIKLQYTIVSNYLSKMDLSHSLQTFNNEIKLIFNPATPFTSEEMSQIIDIENNENNDDFIKTNNSLIGNNTYLYKLINSKSNIFKENKGIQTLNLKESYINDNNDKSLLSLESTNIRSNPNLYEDINEKLKNIDKKYENKFSNNDNILPKKNNLEAKFNRYKKELDEKYREDLNKEIERIKTMEVSKVIIEQNQKYLEKIEKIRDEYENKYELKYKELTEKQKNLKEKENKLQMDYIETTKELISNYQKKLENFYKKEDAFNQKCIKELNEIKEQKNELDKKDKELFNLKKDYYKELQKEIDKLKSEFKTIYKEQLQKIYNEKEQEIEKLKNELNISKMANKLDSSLKLNINKANEQCLKGLTEIKEKLKIIKSENKEKKTELNKRILPSSDLEEEKVKIDIDYYKKISELESQFNSITNKYKYKHFDDNIFKNISYKSDLVIKDDNIKKKLTELENMENEFNTKLEKELKEFIEDIPQVDLSKNEVDRIKENNYQLAVANIEKEKQLFEIYQKEKEEEDLINKIKYMNIINQNMINKQDDLNKDKYIIIDQNEMENHKKMYQKL